MIWKERPGSAPERPEGFEILHVRDSIRGWEMIWLRKLDKKLDNRAVSGTGALWARTPAGEPKQPGVTLTKRGQPKGTPPPAGRWVEVFSFLAVGGFVATLLLLWR